MKSVLLRITSILTAVLSLAIGGTSILPGRTVVGCQITIMAPGHKVFAIVGNLKRFHEFSPWAEDDVGLHYAFAGPESGIGQRMSWTADNPDFGSGSQAMIDYRANQHLAMIVNSQGWRDALVSIDLEPAKDGTTVKWLFKSQKLDPVERSLAFLSYQRQACSDCERGLAKLKAIAEK